MERQRKNTQARLLTVFLVALVASPVAATAEKNNLISLLRAHWHLGETCAVSTSRTMLEETKPRKP